MLWRDRVLTRWPGGRCESLDLFWGSDVGQVVSSSGQGLDIVLLSILLARLRKSDWVGGVVVLNFDFRNRGHLVHPFQSYGRIYFNIFQQKLDDIGWHQGTSKTKIVSRRICIGLIVAFNVNGCGHRNNRKNSGLQTNALNLTTSPLFASLWLVLTDIFGKAVLLHMAREHCAGWMCAWRLQHYNNNESDDDNTYIHHHISFVRAVCALEGCKILS